MTPTATALLGYAAWFLFLLIWLVGMRTALVVGKKKAGNDFDPGGADMSAFGRRLTRAHANCYENFPIAAAIMLYAIATSQTALTDGLAYLFLGARVMQSLIHLSSGANPVVTVRFIFFVIQNVILVIWLLKLFHHI